LSLRLYNSLVGVSAGQDGLHVFLVLALALALGLASQLGTWAQSGLAFGTAGMLALALMCLFFLEAADEKWDVCGRLNEKGQRPKNQRKIQRGHR
jgi:hypothetical protein